MYMCGRLRTASRPSRTLMLSALYSAPGASVPELFCCVGSNVHLSWRKRWFPPPIRGLFRMPQGRMKYHAKSAAVKAIRLGQHSEKTLDFRVFDGLDQALQNGVKSGVAGGRGDQLRVGRGEHHLRSELGQVLHEEGVAR